MAKFVSVSELIESYKSRFIPENADGVNTIIQLRLSGEPSSDFFMMIKDQMCTITEGVHDEAVLTVNATVEDWLMLNNHEVNPMMLMMQGKLKVDGPLHMAAKFRSMFKE
ncbi:MAG: SCP2 sterol-binding domain-containing protein [Rhodothermales bacterium]